MPTYRYTLTGSHSATSYTFDHYHSVDISNLNTAVKNNIPQYSAISSIFLYCQAKTSLSAKADAWWYFSDSSPYRSGYKICGGSELIGSSNTAVSGNIPASYYNSGTSDSGAIKTSYSKLAVTMTATVIRKYTCNSAYVEWTYSLPTYTVNLSANGGGSVTGGGTQEITQFNSVIQKGASWTFKAVPNEGYRFVGWRRVGYTGYITYENNYTYTREQIWANSTVENIEGVFEKIPSGVYLKQNGSFAEAEDIYVKKNGVWVKTDKTAIDRTKKYKIIRS